MPVEALYDWEVGQEVTLRNLLQRHGFESLEEVQAEGLRGSILEVFEARDLAVGDDARAAIAGCRDPEVLKRWHRQAVTAASAADVIGTASE